MRITNKLGLLIAIVVLVGTACTSTEDISDDDIITTTTASGPKVGLNVGDIAPDVELVALDGSVHRLYDFRGQVVFLNFWATWCPPCRVEMPSMQRMYDDYKDEGFIILAVDVRESRDLVERFMEEFELTFPAFLDINGDVYKEFSKSGGIPQTYIIDRDGIIREYIPGSVDWDNIMRRANIQRILEEGKDD